MVFSASARFFLLKRVTCVDIHVTQPRTHTMYVHGYMYGTKTAARKMSLHQNADCGVFQLFPKVCRATAWNFKRVIVSNAAPLTTGTVKMLSKTRYFCGDSLEHKDS